MKTTSIAVLLVIFLFYTTWFPFYTYSFSTNLIKNSLKYELRSPYVATLTHTIHIDVHSRIRDATLYVPLIRNETSHHFVIVSEVTQHYFHDFREDDSGNRYACWRRDEIGRGEVFSVRVQYHILAFRVRFSVNSSLVKQYDNSSAIYQKYTQPEELIQSNNPRIISNATELVNSETNPYVKASKIYQFVVDTLTYEKQEEEKGALWALQNRMGDCSEHAYLFVALCRAARVPARIRAGFAFHNDVETLSNGHMWAEYYLENYGWMPVDPAWNLFGELDRRHFGTLQSKPELMSYANYFFNYSQVGSGGKPSDDQTIVAEKASIHLFDDFPFIQSINDAVSKIERAEQMLQITKLLGAHFFLSSDFKKAEEKISNADFHVQKALEEKIDSVSSAQRFSDEALDLAKSIVFKMVIAFVLFLVIVFVVAVVLYERNRREQNLEYEYSY